MSAFDDMTPAEVAALDAAFAAGVREAMRRGTALLMMRGAIGGQPVWTAAYPPAGLTPRAVDAWARKAGLAPVDGDLFIDATRVHAAAVDLGLG
jgi:hypothetical protein